MQQSEQQQHDEAKIDAIRAELPATQAFAYLNTGTNGPFPRRSYETLAEYARAEMETGRLGKQVFERLIKTRNETRDALAAVLQCDPSDIALTHNTTEGVNIALMGLDWRAGDEVVTASTEHPGVLYPVALLRQRHGIRIRMTDIGLKGRDPMAELRSVLSSRTRAVVLSHVSWSSGMVLPLREIADETHRAGAVLICDAAQACGMVPSPVHDLGVDAYACSGQKWLCGPDGTGALFVRRDRLGDIQPTFLGLWGVKYGMFDNEGYFLPSPGAQRYEVGSFYPASIAALGESLRWIDGKIGWDWVYRRIATLGRLCYESLARLDGVTLLTPPEQMAGLVHFVVEGIAPNDLSAKLSEMGFAVRDTPHPPAVRVSTGFYNTEDEIERLVAAIQTIRSSVAPGA
jgi:L-cysteine/cystine lyase